MSVKRPASKQPIPPHAQRVFRGKVYDVYQWEQDLFNGKRAVFEKLKRPDTVNIIPITSDGEIVLGEQEQPGMTPFIGCLGGKVDEGENPIAAAKRELREEAGMEAAKWILWDSAQIVDKIDWVIYTFIAKGCRRVADQHIEAGEKIKLKFVSFDEFIQVTAQENYRDTEVALKVFRINSNVTQLEKMKKLFTE